MNLSIRQKIFSGYIVMILFTLLVSAYAILSLKELHSLSTDIVFHYVGIGEKLTRLNDHVQAQDLYEKRYLMLQQPEAETMFWTRSKEFKNLLAEIGRVDDMLASSVDAIATAHDAYNALFTQEVSLLRDRKNSQAEAVSSDALKGAMGRITLAMKELDIKVKNQQRHAISESNALSQRALLITAVLSIVALVFGILFASLITNHLNKAISQLKEATSLISSGDFDKLPEFKGDDELSELAVSFKEMTSRLKELEEMNLDANPLTKLPGNLAIEKELLTRLNDDRRFSFCLIDLDNFKAFNDRYSYARGSDLIKWLSDLLLRIRAECGTEEDFLGHIGGDDFVLICDPERVQTYCTTIIEEFDRGIVEHYDPEDAKKGFIISIDRNDKPAMFGIMTVSIAVVNTDRTLIRDPREVTQKVAELKQYAKTFAKSIYIMDRRRIR
ncbi:MAG: diguanylate cyclase [Thermodesulfovibrionales bacterium]